MSDAAMTTSKGSGGIIVSVPSDTNGASCHSCLKGKRYIGIEGSVWPVQLPVMPVLSMGMMQDDNLDACISYWCEIVSKTGFDDAVCLFIGGDAESSEFVFAGFDCGYYVNEYDHLSLIHDELLLGGRFDLDRFRGRLNSCCLFGTRADAASFMNVVNEDNAFRLKYGGCLDELSVVKIFIHKICLPESLIKVGVLRTETFASLDVGNNGTSYDSQLGVDAKVEDQIKNILSRSTTDGIVMSGKSDVKTGIHVTMRSGFNPSFNISPEAIRLMARSNVGIDVDICVIE